MVDLKSLVRAVHTAYAAKAIGGSGFQRICLLNSSTTLFIAAASRPQFTSKLAASERSTIPAKAAQPNLKRFFSSNGTNNMDDRNDSPENQADINALAALSVACDSFFEKLRFATLRWASRA